MGQVNDEEFLKFINHHGVDLRDHICDAGAECGYDFELLITGAEMVEVDGCDVLLPMLKLDAASALRLAGQLVKMVEQGFRCDEEEKEE